MKRSESISRSEVAKKAFEDVKRKEEINSLRMQLRILEWEAELNGTALGRYENGEMPLDIVKQPSSNQLVTAQKQDHLSLKALEIKECWPRNINRMTIKFG